MLMSCARLYPLMMRNDFRSFLNLTVFVSSLIWAGRAFHTLGPAWENALFPYREFTLVSSSFPVLSAPVTREDNTDCGALPTRHLCTVNNNLNTILSFIFSQWYFRNTSSREVEKYLVLINRVAAFCTRWSFFIKDVLIP